MHTVVVCTLTVIWCCRESRSCTASRYETAEPGPHMYVVHDEDDRAVLRLRIAMPRW
ncbi:MAG: hypothetical protein LLG24_00985 [Actinomycetia bacterium]|nr:hypothetical protein [Actinomycetes bacterium]